MLSKFSLPLAVILGAAMICATLVVLNVRAIYPVIDPSSNTLVMPSDQYLRLLARGCAQVLNPSGGIASVSCPLWVRP